MAIDTDVGRRFAETMLFWRQHLRAKDVQDFLGVSERTARTQIAHWRTAGLLPHYRRTGAKRRLQPAGDFDPGLPVKSPVATLGLLLTADDSPGNPFSLVPPPGGGHDLSLSAGVPLGPTREIVSACLDREAVRLVYAAKPGRQDFVFSPSALVRSRGRYHMRGYRSEGFDPAGVQLDDRYVDVIPARAIQARRDGAPFITLDADVDWHEFENRRFELSYKLTNDERICYETEYGISDTGCLEVRQRRALMPYVQQELEERHCWRRDGSSVPIWQTPVSTT